MLHITFSKYDCIIVHKAYYLFTCTCVSINSFHSHSHSHIPSVVICICTINKDKRLLLHPHPVLCSILKELCGIRDNTSSCDIANNSDIVALINDICTAN